MNKSFHAHFTANDFVALRFFLFVSFAGLKEEKRSTDNRSCFWLGGIRRNLCALSHLLTTEKWGLRMIKKNKGVSKV